MAGRGGQTGQSGQRGGSSARGDGRGSPARSGGGASSAPTDDAAVKPIRPPDQAVDRQAEGNEETSAVDANRRRAVIICATPALIAGVVVGLVLVAIGLLVIGAVAWVAVTVALSVWLWRFAPGAVARSVGASPSDESEHPRLHNLVDGLCATMGLPRPTICIVNSPVPNAMAVGRDPATASLLVTSGLDQSLTLVELEGVLAHELVHVKRQDTLVAGLAVMVATPWSVVVGTTRASETVHSLVGRGREFSADQRAAGVVRYPPGIGSALAAMADRPPLAPVWLPGAGRIAQLTRWLWVDPMAGARSGESVVGNLDDTAVRAAALSLP